METNSTSKESSFASAPQTSVSTSASTAAPTTVSAFPLQLQLPSKSNSGSSYLSNPAYDNPDNNKENTTPTVNNPHEHHENGDEVFVCDKRVQTTHPHHPIMTADSRTIPATHYQHHSPDPNQISHQHLAEPSPNSANAAMALSSLFHHNQAPSQRHYHSPYQQQQQHRPDHHPDQQHAGWGRPPPPRYYPQQQQRHPSLPRSKGEHPPPRQSLWHRPYSDVTNGPTYAPPVSGPNSKNGASDSAAPDATFESSQSYASFPTTPKGGPPPVPASAQSYYPPNYAAPPEQYYPSYPTPYTTESSSPAARRAQNYHRHQPSNAQKRPHLHPSSDDQRHLVTPTPKKIKLSSCLPTGSEEYSRKSKSLGLLCENFCKRDWTVEHDNLISIDEAAKSLGVERRRIYDIINILESLEIVQRKCKNAYYWLGFGRLPTVLNAIQKEGIAILPHEAARLLGVVDEQQQHHPVESTTDIMDGGNGTKKSLGRLSRQFLQLFLVGHSVMSLTEASDRIMGKVDVSSHKEENRKAAYVKAQKTKIRRLYDIANVLASIGLVKKTDGERRSRPTFLWIYHWTPQQIQALELDNNSGHERATTPSILPTPRASMEEIDDHRTAAGRDASSQKVKEAASPHDGTKTFLSRIHEHGAREESTIIGNSQRPASSTTDGPGEGNFRHTGN